MRKKTITRLQLLALFLVTGLVLFRVFSGPAFPGGAITINKLDVSELKEVNFELTAPVTFAIEAVGSFTAPDRTEPDDLTVYGWIIDRRTRNVVWKMQDAPLSVDNTLATAIDTTVLEPGSYAAYFTTYGNFIDNSRGRIFGVRYGRAWIGDADDWYFVLRTVPPSSESSVRVGAEEEGLSNDRHTVWSTGPVSVAGTQQYVFDVTRDVALDIYAVGEYCKSPCDYGAITDYVSGDTLWILTLTNSRPAGGRQENIEFRGTIQVPPGTYRAFYKSDYGHSYNNWSANPPFDPRAWGMKISVTSDDDTQYVKAFDPWLERDPLISITKVGAGRDERVPFKVTDSVTVLIYAMGELSSSGSLYDYPSIKDVATGNKIWEMSYRASEPAGGYETNRKEVAILKLVPGRYELTYQSDMSHDYSAFSNGEPKHPERWGVTMFPFEKNIDAGTIEVQASVAASRPAPRVTVGEIDAGQVIVNATQLGNGQNISNSFNLNALTIVRVVAVGEISTSGQYDYGWIEDNDTGNIVWEMTRRNTQPAGGDDHNRKFEGLLELEPGNYTVHFKTDFTHAFGDFGEGGPDNPTQWGIQIEKLLSND